MGDVLEDITEYVRRAKLVAFDGCHKLYIALDDVEADWFRGSSYETFEGSVDGMIDKVLEWFDGSCNLRFISAVSTVNFETVFLPIISQG